MTRSGLVRITKKLHASDRATICTPLFALGADIASNVTPIHMTKTLSVRDSVSAHEFQLKIGPDKEYNKIKIVKIFPLIFGNSLRIEKASINQDSADTSDCATINS